MLIYFLIATPLILVTSCKDDEDASGMVVNLTDNSTRLQVKMTDAPAVYQEVNVDIESVSVHYGDSTDSGMWMDLATNSGIYNLLELQNDVSVVLADENGLPPGEIGQMRLLLGEENTVVVDSVAFDLKTPSAQQSGLKINLDFVLEPGKQYMILLDFDAGKSVVEQGNGGFLLKPVIRVDSIVELVPGMVVPVTVMRTEDPSPVNE